MDDLNFVEFTDHVQDTREDDLIAAIRAYLTLDFDPDKILQRGNDLAGKYYDAMIDIGEEFGIVEYSSVPRKAK